MSSRSNTRLLQFTKGREQKRSASAVANAFNAKQSHYARRSEEEAIRRESAASSDTVAQQLSAFDVAHHKTSSAVDMGARNARGSRFGNSGGGRNAWSLNDAGDDLLRAQSRMSGRSASGSLGVRTAGALGDERDGESGEPAAGKRARFEEILDRAKDDRAEKKVLRIESERETDQLDKAFGQIEALLQTKTKRQEAQEAFYEMGSEGTRARLAAFFEQRKADKGREFVLTRGAKTLVRVDGGAAAVAGGGVAEPIRAPEKVEAKQQLKNKKKEQQQQPPAAPAAAAAADPRVERLRATAGAATEEDDGFDKLMGQMLFSRKAHAGDRAYSKEDALLDQFQEELLGVDQLKRAQAGALVPEVADTTRREWLARGGDAVYRMADDEQQQEDEEDDEEGDEEEGDDDDDEDDIDFDALDGEEDFDFDRPDAAAQLARLKEQQKQVSDKIAAKKQQKQQQQQQGIALSPVDEALAKLEKTLNECMQAAVGGADAAASSHTKLSAALDSLHEVCALRPRMAAEAFRLLFLDISSTQLVPSTGGVNSERPRLTPFQLLILRAATRMFPMSDISRHPVAAPLSLLLPSLMFYGPALNTPADAATLLFLASTMMDLLRGGSGSSTDAVRPGQVFFAAEPFLAICNVLALQLPVSVLAPRGKTAKVDAPFPVLPRADEPVLSAASSSVGCLSLLGLMALVRSKSSSNVSPVQQQQILATAYDLAEGFIRDFLARSPSAPALLASCITGFLTPRLISDANNNRQRKLQALCDEVVAAVEGERAPLAMRTFRPRPLRVYEPLLMDDSEDELKDRRAMKRELREGKKRVIRSVQATAAVERRQHERDAAVEDRHRAGKLRELMGELQAQQKTMNFVDEMKAKAKSKKRGKISGAPTGDPSGGDSAEGPAE